MNKYAIYTEGNVYPVLEKDGQYYIGIPNTGHFSGNWKFLGVRERLRNSRVIIKPEDALKITDWQFKNGSPRYQVVDLDHGTVRTWAGTAANQQLRSFDTISDSGFSLATKTDNDEEITLEESKKYAVYATYGGDGVYNSKLVDTVDSEEQAIDRVAELQATGVGASYEEVEVKNESEDPARFGTYKPGDIVQIEDTYSHKYFGKYKVIRELTDEERNPIYGSGVIGYELETIEPEKFAGEITRSNNYRMKPYKELNEECSQASGVASGANGKIDSFPIDPKEMEKQRLKEDINNPYFVIEDIGAAYLMAGPFKTKAEAERKKKEQIKEYNLEDEAEIIHVWDWNTIKEFEDNAYDTYQEFINAGDSAPYYKEEKLEESKEDDIFNAREELIDYLNENTKYEWDANESYDNCAITESETDYIEVFVDIKDGNKIYTVDNYSYNSLEELVKNMPVLFTDEDENYDYDEGWEDEEEYQADKELDQKKTNKFNSEGPASFEHLKNLGIFDKKESKDLTETLQEMALLEDYEDDISPQKKKFIEFCKDKIKDLGDIEIYDETWEENVQYHKIMHTEGIREFNDLYIVANFEESDENLKAINSENKMVIDTPMIDCNGYAATMQFDEIDQEYYHTLLEYWNDLYMDEMIDDEEE